MRMRYCICVYQQATGDHTYSLLLWLWDSHSAPALCMLLRLWEQQQPAVHSWPVILQKRGGEKHTATAYK
jgi:hypothetical protein